MDSRKIPVLERQIAKIKGELMALGDLRIGSLSRQYNVCSTPGCRCKASPPQKHGPYHQISFTRKGKSGTNNVRKDSLPTVQRQLRNYAKLRKLVDRWIELATKLSVLKTGAGQRQNQTPSRRVT